MREERSFVTLACWWIQCHLLLLLGVHLCGGNGKRSIGCGPVPGGADVLPPLPGGLFSENPEAGCVCMVWPYPVWRADGSVFSLSWSNGVSF